MPHEYIPILAVLFLVVGALYASVGHAGASGYLAVMALLGVDALVMRPTALTINIPVAAIAFVLFARAGHFSWPLFWPFAAAAVPAAFLGGSIHVPTDPLKLSIGVVLLLSAVRMAWTGLRPSRMAVPPHTPTLVAAVTCGAVIGLAAGLTGTGGGIFLSPVMVIFNWADIKRTAATSSLFILFNSLAGLGGLASRGWTPAPWLLVLAGAASAGGLAGAYVGSRKMSHRPLRLLLASVLIVASVKLILI